MWHDPLNMFEAFLADFVPRLERKSTQLNRAAWLLETTGAADAALLKADLDVEYRLLMSDPALYQNLLRWDAELQDPLLKRQSNVLIRSFQQNQIPPLLIEQLAQKEAEIAYQYAQFRPELEGKRVSENEIRQILSTESDLKRRKKAWEASKSIGQLLAPRILEVVALRNRAAQSLGYSDFFEMQLGLQEVDGAWLLAMFEDLSKRSDSAYTQLISEIESVQGVGPWVWSEPFCQEDPLDSQELNGLVKGLDLVSACTTFYDQMGIDVREVLARSDMFERPGKNQHAFCTHIDRRGDVRTLNNVKNTLKWLETLLHELGHAVYELGLGSDLPWLLRAPPHMIPTEAMALLAGRQAYTPDSLALLLGREDPLSLKAAASLKRRQLIFSRWVLVMTAFESALYRNPAQDLNLLWWDLVEKIQKIPRPAGREGKWDWATKYHLGLAPVYYFSYLLGELFASSLLQKFVLPTPAAGQFLQKHLFAPGDRLPWNLLVQEVTGAPLTPDAWLEAFS